MNETNNLMAAHQLLIKNTKKKKAEQPDEIIRAIRLWELYLPIKRRAFHSPPFSYEVGILEANHSF